MSTYQQACQKQIDDIMDEFDFDKVHRVMEHLDWTWQDNDEPPSRADIRRSAREQLRSIVSECEKSGDGYYASGTGGFHASVQKGTFPDEGPWVRVMLAFYVDETGGDCGDGVNYVNAESIHPESKP